MNQNTIELAISALEAEKVKIDAAIAELGGGTIGRPAARKVAPATAMGVATSPKPAGGRPRKRRITAAGRAALAAAAKRRWAKTKAAGKKSL
jgi:hypothetical protein